MSHTKTFAAIEKLKEVELELHRLKNALEMMNKAHDVKREWNDWRSEYEEREPYAEPPQREWVGLTDEEIREGNSESWVTTQAWQSACWWAEAKLKEKNGY